MLVTFEDTIGERFSYEVEVLANDSAQDIVNKVSLAHAKQGRNPAPADIKRLISIQDTTNGGMLLPRLRPQFCFCTKGSWAPGTVFHIRRCERKIIVPVPFPGNLSLCQELTDKDLTLEVTDPVIKNEQWRICEACLFHFQIEKKDFI